MAIYKKAIFNYKCPVKALNNPKGKGWDIYELPNQIKTASTSIVSEDLNGFDLKKATKDHPDHLFVKIFAIKKDEPNDNGDAFSESELKSAAHTFVGVPLFTNHQNDDVEKSRGECVHSWYDNEAGGIFIIGRVDKIAYPRLARGIEQGYITGTSMGAINGDAVVTMQDLSLKKISEISVGDKVLTPFGNKKEVKEIHSDLLLKDMYHFDIGNFAESPLFTDDHPIMSLRKEDVNKTELGWRGKSYVPEFRHAADISVGDYFLIPSKFKLIEELEEEDLDFYYLLGAFLGDGYIRISRGKIEGFSFCFGLNEKQELAEKIKNIISHYSQYDVIETIKEERNGLYLTCYDRNLATKIMECCGNGSHNKRIKIKEFTSDQIKHLISGYIDSDGTMVKDYSSSNNVVRGFNICSCNKTLLEDVQSLLILLDCIAGIKSIYREPRKNSVVNIGNIEHNLFIGLLSSNLFKESFKVCKNLGDKISNYTSSPNLIINYKGNKYLACRVKQINLIDNYDKEVYDLTVEGDESYIANNIAIHNCSVEHSLCSVCHNLAHTSDEYCSHVSNGKNRKFSGEIACRYHDNGTEDKCPICGSSNNEKKSIKQSDQQVFEYNYGLKFIENSFVVNPACHDCGVKCILHAPEINNKVASFKNTISNLIKRASEDSVFFENNAESLVKLGGVQELQMLKDSMDKLEKIAKSMFSQKENVSMGYVSDIVKAMSELQELYDELVEMGYGALPSPSVVAEVSDTIASPYNSSEHTGEIFPKPSPAPEASVSDMGGLGNVVMPKNSSRKIEEFSKNNEKIINKISSLESLIQELVNSNRNTGAKMAKDIKETKTAAGEENIEVITEKQLENKNTDLHSRTGEAYEGITESKEQLQGSEKYNDTTSSSPQVRKGTYDSITENQLKSDSPYGSSIVHFNDYPDVITEKQWTDFSKSIASSVSDDYIETITESQIRNLLDGHKFVGSPETITEDQLKTISMTDGIKRWASKEYSVGLAKVAMSIVADMIDKFRKAPQEIQKVVTAISEDDGLKAKVAFLSVVNSMPKKEEERKNIASKATYFSKKASSDTVSTIDALVISVADNAKFAMKAEDVLYFVEKVVSDKTAMEKVEKIVESRKTNISDSSIITKADAFNSALKEIDKPVDGKYKIKATLADIDSPITDKVAFVKSVKKFAQEMIGDDSVASAVIRLEVGPEGDLIIDVEDQNVVGDVEEICPDDMGDVIEEEIGEIGADMNGGGAEIEIEMEEDPTEEDFAEENSMEEDSECSAMASVKKEIKKAQMFGGEMGGQGGASQAPGAGATLPAGGEMGASPLESFEGEDLGEEEGEMGMDEGKEPLPPGSICPVCGSEDVDIISGKGKCNNCSSEMTYKVEVNVTKWQGITPSEEDNVEEEEFEGEGFEMPTEEGDMGLESPEMPSVAAYTRLKPKALKKLANEKIEIGSISPATGTTNTVKVASGEYMCMDTGTRYKVSFVVDSKNPDKGAYAQWEWKPKVAGQDCPSCKRAKQRFVKALSSIGMIEEQFDALDLKSKVKTILDLKKAGSLNPIKIASKNGSVMADYKLAYGNWGNSFPIESCVEKLARRYGENAICMSGPDEGKPLATSICNRLRKADVYTDKIAIKLAESWSDCDGDEECITHQIRAGYSLREAASVCEYLKLAVAQAPDFFADSLEETSGEGGMIDENPVEEDVVVEEEDFDPFDGGENDGGIGGGNVTLELPADLVEKLDAQLDKALGENPMEEEHHQDDDSDGIPNGIDSTPEGEGFASEGNIEEVVSPGDLEESKPAEVGFEEEQTEFPGIEEKGDSSENSKVTVRINGVNVGGEDEDEITEETQEFTEKEAMNMRNSIGKTGRSQMDLSGVLKALKKKAEITQEKAQDVKDIGNYTNGEDGSKMGHENETIPTAKKPSIPRDNATMGQEPKDLNPQDKPQPEIPTNNATMGHEEEADLGGVVDTYTGGDKGQGKIETASIEEDLYHMKGFGSPKSSLAGLASKLADKLQPKEPVAKDKDIQPVSNGGTIGNEDKFDVSEPKDVEGNATESLIGHEGETLGKAPKEPADQPDIYTGNAQMGEEELDSEKTTKDKGTVIAKNDSESEAVRIAGRMLEAKRIEPSQLYAKIKELKQYRFEQLKDFEKAIFASKGLNTVSDGLSQPVQINEASSVRNSKEELTDKLQDMFTLGKQNRLASSEDITAIRKAYRK